MAVKTYKPASEKQLDLIRRVTPEKVVPVAGKDTDEAWLIARHEDCFSGKDVSSGEASKVIDWLFSLPKQPTAQLKPGIYRAPNGDVIKVKAAKAHGGVYAQVMVVKGTSTRINLKDDVVPAFDFVYTPGLIRHITPDMLLTLEDAKEFYIKTGRCLNCKKELKVAASIAKGLGPTCAKMFGV